MGHQFKPVDVLEDIRQKEKKKTTKAPIIKAIKEQCPKGMVCFEDYSSKQDALKFLLQALDSTKQKGRITRIGFYGDSYVEGDIITEYLRDTLQSYYGGRGVGFVPITTLVPGFRQTINFSFAGFHTYCIVGDHPGNIKLGPAEMTFIPESNSYVSYQSAEKRRFLERFNEVKLYYSSTQNANVSCSIDQQVIQTLLPANPGMGQVAWHCDSAKAVKFSFSANSSLHLYGAAFDNDKGLYVDNFSVRGNSGLGLQNADSTLFTHFDSLRHYDAIFLEYGLNVASASTKKFDFYEKGMIKSINRLKKLYPKTSIILIGVGDRSTRKNGDFVTMESIPLLVESQRKIAASTGIAFWDLFTAMGGENSMPNFVNASPPMANKDYTHLTFAGGKKIGKILAETIFFEHKRYDHQHQEALP